MRSLRITTALVLMVFAARGARAAADEPRAGEFFSGAFMIALRGEAAEAIRRELTDPENRSPLTLMYAASESEENELDASTWVLTRPYVNEGSAGPGNASAWDDAYEILDYPKILGELGFSEKVIALMAKPGAVQAIEPDIAIWDPEIEELHRRLADAGEVPDDLHDAEADRGAEPPYLVAAAVLPARGTTVTVAKGERFAGPWPPPRNSPFAWHFDGDHSNLAAARAKVQASERPAKVIIYHLDTGYYAANDTMRPRYLDPVRSISFLTDDGHTGKPHFPPSGEDRFRGGVLSNAGHGAKTLSILAGDEISVPSRDYNGFLGGAPFARVASCRIAQSVVHFRTATMAHAIFTAIRQRADVITMAAGGPPSIALRDAVNTAYGSGIPMFFAAGDYFQTLIGQEIPPHTTVYPARFGRAMAVTGVTAEQKDYGRATYLLFGRAQWLSMRGSYGPKEVLRHSLAAYTPNVAAQFTHKRRPVDVVTERFGGTSAATPQVAAAAALWLQVHGKDRRLQPKDWKTAEAVYQALFLSARHRRSAADPHRYFGRGTLDALGALALEPRELPLSPRPGSRITFDWLAAAAISIGVLDAAVFGPHAAAKKRMAIVEMTQLYHGSNLLRQILGSDPDKADRARQEKFLRAILRDARSSNTLKKMIGQLLR